MKCFSKVRNIVISILTLSTLECLHSVTSSSAYLCCFHFYSMPPSFLLLSDISRYTCIFVFLLLLCHKFPRFCFFPVLETRHSLFLEERFWLVVRNKEIGQHVLIACCLSLLVFTVSNHLVTWLDWSEYRIGNSLIILRKADRTETTKMYWVLIQFKVIQEITISS